MAPETLARIEARGFTKGDVLGVAQLAGIMGAKHTPDLIPLCHPLAADLGARSSWRRMPARPASRSAPPAGSPAGPGSRWRR